MGAGYTCELLLLIFVKLFNATILSDSKKYKEFKFSKLDNTLTRENIQSFLSTADYLSQIDKDKLSAASLDNNIIGISAKTYFIKVDEYGVNVPLTKKEYETLQSTSNDDVNLLSQREYTGVTIYSTVSDNSSTSTTRKYMLDGQALFTAAFNNTNDLNDSVGISWAGGEAITSDTGGAWYYTGKFGDTPNMIWVDGHRDTVDNNKSLNYKFYGLYLYNPPAIFGVRAYTQQYGAPTQTWNMTTTWVQHG